MSVVKFNNQKIDYNMDLGVWHKPDCDIDRTNMDESFEQYSLPTISDWIRHIDKLIMMTQASEPKQLYLRPLGAVLGLGVARGAPDKKLTIFDIKILYLV